MFKFVSKFVDSIVNTCKSCKDVVDLDIFTIESLILDNCVIISKLLHGLYCYIKNHYISSAQHQYSTTDVKLLKNYAFSTNTDIMFY